MLLQFDQSTTNEKHGDVQKLNPDAEVIQFLENTTTDKKRIEGVSSVPVPTQKDEVLAVTGGGSTGRSQNMCAWQFRISVSLVGKFKRQQRSIYHPKENHQNNDRC
jgi:hypothetical protein